MTLIKDKVTVHKIRSEVTVFLFLFLAKITNLNKFFESERLDEINGRLKGGGRDDALAVGEVN